MGSDNEYEHQSSAKPVSKWINHMDRRPRIMKDMQKYTEMYDIIHNRMEIALAEHSKKFHEQHPTALPRLNETTKNKTI